MGGLLAGLLVGGADRDVERGVGEGVELPGTIGGEGEES